MLICGLAFPGVRPGVDMMESSPPTPPPLEGVSGRLDGVSGPPGVPGAGLAPRRMEAPLTPFSSALRGEAHHRALRLAETIYTPDACPPRRTLR